MNAYLRGSLLVALLGIASAGVLGCGDGESTEAMTLKGFHGIKAGTDGCVHTEQPISNSTFDVGLAARGASEFHVYLELINNLKNNESADAGRLNSNQIKVESVEIFFERSEPWAFLPESVSVDAGIVLDTGERHMAPIAAIPQAVAIQILEEGLLRDLGPTKLRFSAKGKGKLFDGTKAASNELSFAVTVCEDCINPCGGLVPEAVCMGAGAQLDGFACPGSAKEPEPDVDGAGGSGGAGSR